MRFEVGSPAFSPVVAILCATTLVIAACILLVGCSNETNGSYDTGSITTGAIAPAPATVRSPKMAIVHPGDTLHAIARRNNVAVYDLMTVNGLTSSRIEVGQALNIPTY